MADAFTGEIRLFSGNFAPRDWEYCHGQLLNIASYTALFSLIGDTYGGNGVTTFGLPDLRGRTLMGSGAAPGVQVHKLRGMMAGADESVLTLQTMPPHSHTITDASVTHSLTATGTANVKCSNNTGNSTSPENKTFAKTKDLGGDTIYGDGEDKQLKVGSVDLNLPVTGNILVSGHTSSVGNGLPFSNLPPYGVADYIICTDGIYPSRP